jgi:hypothetical protein
MRPYGILFKAVIFDILISNLLQGA